MFVDQQLSYPSTAWGFHIASNSLLCLATHFGLQFLIFKIDNDYYLDNQILKDLVA